MSDSMRIQNSFFDVATERRHGMQHGHWIPLTFWAWQISQKIDEEIPPKSLLQKLNKANMIGR
jgi:hypothetical protein